MALTKQQKRMVAIWAYNDADKGVDRFANHRRIRELRNRLEARRKAGELTPEQEKRLDECRKIRNLPRLDTEKNK